MQQIYLLTLAILFSKIVLMVCFSFNPFDLLECHEDSAFFVHNFVKTVICLLGLAWHVLGWCVVIFLLIFMLLVNFSNAIAGLWYAEIILLLISMPSINGSSIIDIYKTLQEQVVLPHMLCRYRIPMVIQNFWLS